MSGVRLSGDQAGTALVALLADEAYERAAAESEAAGLSTPVSPDHMALRAEVSEVVEVLAAAVWLPDALPRHRERHLANARHRFARLYPSLAPVAWTEA